MSVTTEQLIAAAKEGADLTNVTDYVTDAQWVSWLNDGSRELHRFVTNKFRATYYRTYDFTIAAGDSQVTLPSNFWRLRGLDLDAGTIQRRSVLPFNFAERNSHQRDYLRMFGPTLFAADRYYNVLGSRLLQIQPEEHAAGSYRLYYVPKPKTLALVFTIPRDPGDDEILATGGPDGEPLYTFDQFSGFTEENIGDLLTVAGAFETPNDGTRTILGAPSGSAVFTDGSAVSETPGGGVVFTLSRCLDPELEPYQEYVWLTASIKSLIKEESFAQARELKEQRNLIRADLTESVEQDQGGPQTIIDTDGDW